MATRLVTQFDDPSRRGLLVATPTCCSCCCCLVSTVTSATLAGVLVHRTARATGVPRPRRLRLTLVAAVAGPLAIVLAIAAGWSVTMGGSGGYPNDLEHALAVLGGLIVVAAWGYGLVRLLSRAGHERSWRPALGLVGGTLAGFALELLTLGLFVYGQLAVFVVPLLAAELLGRRMDRRPPEVVAEAGGRSS